MIRIKMTRMMLSGAILPKKMKVAKDIKENTTLFNTDVFQELSFGVVRKVI